MNEIKEEEDECSICYTNNNSYIKTCSNGHVCCIDCIKKIKICHMCREIIPDIEEIIYTNCFSIFDIVSNIKITSYYLKNDYHKIYGYINDYELSILTSAKINKEYVLYNIVSNIDDPIIKTTCPTKWYKSLNYLTSNNKYLIGYYIAITIPCDKVLLDINYVYSSTKEEVLVLKGDYQYVPIKHTTSDNITIYDFNIDNRNRFITANKNDKFYCTINSLKDICRQHNISNYSKLRKSELIDHIILYNFNHNS